MEKGNLQFVFIAGGVFLVNFDFSFPRIPKIASLLYFWVFVVKKKIKNSIKSAARCDKGGLRFGLKN